MSKKSDLAMGAFAGVAALAGFGYVAARRSRRSRNSTAPVRPTAGPPMSEALELESGPEAWEDAARISSTPDALDLALSLEAEPENEIELTARTMRQPPLPTAGDDDEAPSPDDLGSAWLKQATESEHSLSDADIFPEVENVTRVSDELGASNDSDGEDETTREYIRRHRISLLG